MPSPRAVKALTVSACGLEFAFAVGLFTWLGVRADTRLDLAPIFTLTGLFFGLGIGFLSLYRTADRLKDRDGGR